ncbi:hypothetical protein X798_01970 [Onchocerca flexuosa]|uniref:Uncharacterized protein n=1 Tax=Onchocerca flexuosa TaxID=387005 RepID=A0A238C190_9BILA|nr:hypothetical protein X798_01970 [Onchocerca flexuosa]
MHDAHNRPCRNSSDEDRTLGEVIASQITEVEIFMERNRKDALMTFTMNNVTSYPLQLPLLNHMISTPLIHVQLYQADRAIRAMRRKVQNIRHHPSDDVHDTSHQEE